MVQGVERKFELLAQGEFRVERKFEIFELHDEHAGQGFSIVCITDCSRQLQPCLPSKTFHQKLL